MKVLFVQEEPFLATTIKLTMLTKGFELVVSEDLSNPSSVIHEVDPDIVVADINSAGGINYVVEAKKKNVPVIVISANENQRRLQRAFDEGADDYICLPISVTELTLRVSLLTREQVA
jgi:DNA-binding response OmpR family regulator